MISRVVVTTIVMTMIRTTNKPFVIRVLIAALLAVFLWPGAAIGHGIWAWVMSYTNANGTSCCGPVDTAFISHEAASSAQVGSVIVAKFYGVEKAVVINKIYPFTKDPQGRAVVTRYGCLFRWSGG